jgi:hypothetical protein
MWSYFKAMAQMILIGFQTLPFVNTSCNSMTEWCQIEHWVTLACLYLGPIFYSLLIASIHSIIQTNNLATCRYEERLTNLDGFLRREKLPPDQCQRIKEDFVQRHSQHQLYNEADALMDMEPRRIEFICWNRNKELTECCPLFMNLQNRSPVTSQGAYYLSPKRVDFFSSFAWVPCLFG